jgi:hypothetical protein
MLCNIILQDGDGKLVQTGPTQASHPYTHLNADGTTSSDKLQRLFFNTHNSARHLSIHAKTKASLSTP